MNWDAKTPPAWSDFFYFFWPRSAWYLLEIMATPTNAGLPQLRRFLQTALSVDSDFDALCLDYFPEVYRRFSAGMDRSRKLTLLMATHTPQEILAAIWDMDPQRCERFRDLLTGNAATAETIPNSETAVPQPKSHTQPTVPNRILEREELLDILCALDVAVFDLVQFRLNLRSAVLLPKTAPQSQRAVQIIEMLEAENNGLARLTAAIHKTAPDRLK